MVSIIVALLAGCPTIAAPCTLPVLPVILGASVGEHGGARPAFIALGFVASFSAVVLILGAVTQALGLEPDTLRTVAILCLVLFGLLMIWPPPFDPAMPPTRPAIPPSPAAFPPHPTPNISPSP